MKFEKKLPLKFLDCLCYFTTIAGSNPGSWALVESHCLYFCFIDGTFRRMCADLNRAIFCTFVTLIFPGFLSICFSIPFLTTPSAPMTTSTICDFIPHIFVIFISKSLNLESFSATSIDVFRSDGTAISMSIHVFSRLSLMMMLSLLTLIVLSVFTCISQSIVAFSFSVTVFGWCSYHLVVVLML